MMSSRRVLILLAVAIVIIVGATWLASSRDAAQSALVGSRVLPDLQNSLNDVTEIRVSKGDGTRTTLQKRESGWIVAEREFPADIGRVRKLLLDLAELNVVEEKTREPDNYAQLGVEAVDSPEATGTLVEAVTPKRTYSLIVGKLSGTRSSYVRLADSPQSLLASPQLMLEADPKRWIDRTIVDIPQDRIKEVEIDPTSGPTYTVTRESKEQENFTVPDLPKGRELASPSAANPVASGLVSLTLDDVRRAAGESGKEGNEKDGKSAGKKRSSGDGASARATFRTFDGLEIQLSGREDGDRRFISVSARASSPEAQAEADRLNARFAGWELEIPGYKYDGLFRPLEELLASKD